VVAKERARITATTTPKELFAIFREMIEPMHTALERATGARRR
jgi:hypothetical protein